MSKKFIEVFPVCTVIYRSLSCNGVMSFFLDLTKELHQIISLLVRRLGMRLRW